MRRATITLPDDLEAELDSFLSTQEMKPSLTVIMEAALRHFLHEKSLAIRQYRAPLGPLEITPAEEGSGLTDVSEQHDRYLVAAE